MTTIDTETIPESNDLLEELAVITPATRVAMRTRVARACQQLLDAHHTILVAASVYDSFMGFEDVMLGNRGLSDDDFTYRRLAIDEDLGLDVMHQLLATINELVVKTAEGMPEVRWSLSEIEDRLREFAAE